MLFFTAGHMLLLTMPVIEGLSHRRFVSNGNYMAMSFSNRGMRSITTATEMAIINEIRNAQWGLCGR